MLISKDENIKSSAVYVASLILKHFQAKKAQQLTVFEVSQNLKKYNIVHYRQVFFGLTLLYTTGIIDFREPYIYILNDKD